MATKDCMRSAIKEELETLVKEYDNAQSRANTAKQLVQTRVVFKGFNEQYDFEMPSVEECSDGLIAVWGDEEIQIDKVIKLMNTKGYVEPDDFV